MKKEKIEMKKRIDALKAKGEKLFDEEKKPAADTSQKNKNKNKKLKYKNLWPPSEETKKPQETSAGYKFNTDPILSEQLKTIR